MVSDELPPPTDEMTFHRGFQRREGRQVLALGARRAESALLTCRYRPAGEEKVWLTVVPEEEPARIGRGAAIRIPAATYISSRLIIAYETQSSMEAHRPGRNDGGAALTGATERLAFFDSLSSPSSDTKEPTDEPEPEPEPARGA